MKTGFVASCIAFTVSLGIASAVSPTINLTWSDPGDPPQPDQNYIITPNPPAGPDYPNLELRTGSDSWRVWSTDMDNTDPNYDDGTGDIGAISSPADDNFTLKLAAFQNCFEGSDRNTSVSGCDALDLLDFSLVPPYVTNPRR